MLQCVAVRHSVHLERFISSAEHPAGNTHQCVAVRCSVCCSMLQCVTVCCNMLQCVAVCILRGVSRVQSILPTPKVSVQGQSTIVVLRCVALCCAVLRFVAVRCTVLQCSIVGHFFFFLGIKMSLF